MKWAVDIPDVGRNHNLYFFLVPVCKIISVQEISDSLFVDQLDQSNQCWFDPIKHRMNV